MNKIEINFIQCSIAPSGGYEIKYRVAGSDDVHTSAGLFFTSPAVFYDTVNPVGTCYEGFLRAMCGLVAGNMIDWQSCDSVVVVGDSSSCNTVISTTTESPNYASLGQTVLHVDGAFYVTLSWEVFGRPNRFTLYDDGGLVETTGWKGFASYPGPWGLSLSTAETGTIGFAPIPGHEYSILIEVGPADPDNIVADNFYLNVNCSGIE